MSEGLVIFGLLAAAIAFWAYRLIRYAFGEMTADDAQGRPGVIAKHILIVVMAFLAAMFMVDLFFYVLIH